MSASRGARKLRLAYLSDDSAFSTRSVMSRRGTAIDRFLQDQVEFLRFGDLLDDPIGALEQRLQLLVAPQIQVLAIFALQALEIETDARELLLLRAAIALAHRHRVFLQLTLEAS